MLYFVKVSSSFAPRNNLQKRVVYLANRWDRACTDRPSELKGDLEKVLADAHHKYPRCKPIKLNQTFAGFTEGIISYSYWLSEENSHGALVTVTLYRIEAEPLPMVIGKEVANG